MKLYKNYKEKTEWMVEQFNPVFENSSSILDIGCYEKCLKKHVPDKVKYVGVDIYGNPDIHFDLDKRESLPFENNSFDLVVCIDVLEHLENIHFVFDDLIRVSNKYVLVSFPNPLSGVYAYFLGRDYSETLEKQKGFGKHMKFYGLPLERPNDRHRWFFSTEESINFINYRIENTNFKVEKTIYTMDFQKGFKKNLKAMLSAFNRKKMLNLFNGATWFLIKKRT